MHVAGFFCAGLARQDRGEWRLALAEAIECGDDVVEGFEAVHAFGAAAEFAGSLRPAEEKHAEDSDFAAIEVENFLQAMFVLGDPAVGAAGGPARRFSCSVARAHDGVFVESHHGIAIVFLIAGVTRAFRESG